MAEPVKADAATWTRAMARQKADEEIVYRPYEQRPWLAFRYESIYNRK